MNLMKLILNGNYELIKEMALRFDVISIGFFLFALMSCYLYIVKIIIQHKVFNTNSVPFLSWLAGFLGMLLLAFVILGLNGLSSIINIDAIYITTLSLFGVSVFACGLWLLSFVIKLSGINISKWLRGISCMSLAAITMNFSNWILYGLFFIVCVFLLLYGIHTFTKWLNEKGSE